MDGLEGALSRFSQNKDKKVNPRGELLIEIVALTGLPKGRVLTQTKGMNEKDLRYIMSVCKDGVATGRKKNWAHAWNSEMVRIWKPKY